MDKVNSSVHRINRELVECRQKLQVIERSAETTVKAKVEDIRGNLKGADHLIDNVREQTTTYLHRLEDVEKASTTVNMQSQMTWLHNRLDDIILDLDAADSHAKDAAQSTNQYIYKVMDIKQEVEVNSSTLADHQLTAERLLALARSDVTENEARIRSANATISSNETSIKSKKATIETKTKSKANLEGQVAAKQNQINRARSEQRDRKAQAIGSGGLAVLGILAAPFTLGASLAVTAAAGGTAVYKAVRMDEFEEEGNRLQNSLNTINSEIASNNRAVIDLEHETERLQSEIMTRRTEITDKRAELQKLEQQIASNQKTSTEIVEVKDHAGLISNSVTQAIPDLQNVRNNLTKCSDLVRERSREISDNTEQRHRFLAMVPVFGTNLKRRKDYEKQIEVVREVLQNLDKIHRDMPSLMPARNSKLFLDVKPWNAADVSVKALHENIPAVVYFED